MSDHFKPDPAKALHETGPPVVIPWPGPPHRCTDCQWREAPDVAGRNKVQPRRPGPATAGAPEAVRRLLRDCRPKDIGYVVTGESAACLWTGGTPHFLELQLVGHRDASSANSALRALSAPFERFIQDGASVVFTAKRERACVDCRLWPDVRTLLSHASGHCWPGTAMLFGGCHTRPPPPSEAT